MLRFKRSVGLSLLTRETKRIFWTTRLFTKPHRLTCQWMNQIQSMVLDNWCVKLLKLTTTGCTTVRRKINLKKRSLKIHLWRMKIKFVLSKDITTKYGSCQQKLLFVFVALCIHITRTVEKIFTKMCLLWLNGFQLVKNGSRLLIFRQLYVFRRKFLRILLRSLAGLFKVFLAKFKRWNLPLFRELTPKLINIRLLILTRLRLKTSLNK